MASTPVAEKKYSCARCYIEFESKQPSCSVEVSHVSYGGEMMNGVLCDKCSYLLYEWIMDGYCEDLDRREGYKPPPPPNYYARLGLGPFYAAKKAEEIQIGLKYHNDHHLKSQDIVAGKFDADCFFCKLILDYEERKKRIGRPGKLY